MIAAPHKPSDSFPRPVPELNRSVVSKAFQSVRDIDVCTGHPDSREQPVEELPRLADERNALLVLVEPGSLAHEHEVGVRVTDPVHDLRAGLREPAARASRCLVPQETQRVTHGRGV